jgi:hypothetical protein
VVDHWYYAEIGKSRPLQNDGGLAVCNRWKPRLGLTVNSNRFWRGLLPGCTAPVVGCQRSGNPLVE